MDGDDGLYIDLRIQLRNYSFEIQVYEILQILRMSQQDCWHVIKLLRDLRSTFDEIWPGCKVKLFGSVSTGLAFTNSDVDCLVQLPPHSQDDPATCIVMTHIFLCSRSTALEYESSAPNATFPSITLRHSRIGRHCDITFNGSLAVETSKLIKYLLSLDSRAHVLAILIKFWSKKFYLTISRRLSNHSVTLLVIFFLQRKNILPSVVSLQENIIQDTEGWNTAFNRIHYASNNYESLYKLLGDFFKFYSNFDFETFVVCTYTGYPVRKSSFLSYSSVPTEFKLYREHLGKGAKPIILSNVCIQDPFEHNRNCSALVTPRLTYRMRDCCQISCYYYEQCSRWDFLRNLIFHAQTNTYRSPPIIRFTFLKDDEELNKRTWPFYIFVSFALITFCSLLFTLTQTTRP